MGSPFVAMIVMDVLLQLVGGSSDVVTVAFYCCSMGDRSLLHEYLIIPALMPLAIFPCSRIFQQQLCWPDALHGTTDHCHLQRLHICSCAVPVAFPTVLPSSNGALSGTASDASTTVARLHICAHFMPVFSTALRQGGLSRRVQAKGARSSRS